jgi:hypothetical protein
MSARTDRAPIRSAAQRGALPMLISATHARRVLLYRLCLAGRGRGHRSPTPRTQTARRFLESLAREPFGDPDAPAQSSRARAEPNARGRTYLGIHLAFAHLTASGRIVGRWWYC